jgi:four helix bundle protein
MLNTKHETRSPKQTQNSNNKNIKHYDLEERTYLFAKNCRNLVKNLTKTIATIEDGKQLIKSSGSVAANYIEANESLSKKDFLMRIKICRKEAKESCLWLKLIQADSKNLLKQQELIKEAIELTNIFGSIVRKCS